MNGDQLVEQEYAAAMDCGRLFGILEIAYLLFHADDEKNKGKRVDFYTTADFARQNYMLAASRPLEFFTYTGDRLWVVWSNGLSYPTDAKLLREGWDVMRGRLLPPTKLDTIGKAVFAQGYYQQRQAIVDAIIARAKECKARKAERVEKERVAEKAGEAA